MKHVGRKNANSNVHNRKFVKNDLKLFTLSTLGVLVENETADI